MKKTFFAAMLLLAFVAYSCTPKEEVTPSDKSIVNDGSIVFAPTATIEDFVFDGPATKTTVAFDGDNAPEFTFEASDILGVYPYTPLQGDQVRFKVKESSTAWAAFDGQGFGLKSGQYYAAYYPADIANAAAEKMTAIPVDYTGQRQTGKTTYGIAKADYLVANNVTPENNACSFSMHHVGALLVMDITFPEAGNYNAITLTSEGTPFVVDGAMDLTAEEIAVDPVSTSATVTLALGEEGGSGLAIAAGETVRFCMMVAPANLKNSKVTLAAGSGSVEFASFKEFKAGKAYKVTCTLGQEAPAEPTNLSEIETANCYIVSAAGDYYFDASVAGNGMAGVIPNEAASGNGAWYPAKGTCALTVAPDANAPIWVIFIENNCITDVQYEASSKTISFKATGNEGNAKISLDRGGHDAIWTWHIWCTDKPKTMTYNAPAAPNNTFTIMDRNLGATMSTSQELQSVDDIPKLCGLYYQWGRPIPFSPDNGNWAGSLSGEFGMESTFMNAHKFFKSPANSMYFNTATLDSDWNIAKRAIGRLWGNDVNQCTSWLPVQQIQKTIYDPCPAGYQVAPVDFMRNFDDTNNYSNLSADAHGVWLSGSGEVSAVYFPYAGCCNENGLVSYTTYNGGQGRFHGLEGGDPYNDGCGVHIWTSGNGQSNACWEWTISYRNDARGSFGGTQIVMSSEGSKGQSVRCVADGN